MTTIHPLEDRVLVVPDPADDVTKGGIILPDAAQDKPQKGTVVAVGEGTTTIYGVEILPTVDVGDKILYSKYGGTEFTEGGETYLILNCRDVLAVVR